MKKTMAVLALLMCLLPAAASADVWLKDKPGEKLTGPVNLSGEKVELVGDGQPTDVWFIVKEETKEITFEHVCAQTDGVVLNTDNGLWYNPLTLTFAGEQASSLTSRTTHAIDTHRILTDSGSGAVIQGGSGKTGGSGIQGKNGDVTISADNITIRGGKGEAAGSDSSTFVTVEGGYGIYTDKADVTISGSHVKISGGAADQGAGYGYYGSARGGIGVHTGTGSSVTISGSDVEISGGDARGFSATGGTGVDSDWTLTIRDAGVTIRGGAASGGYDAKGGDCVSVGSAMEIAGTAQDGQLPGADDDSDMKGVTILGGEASGGQYSSGGAGVLMGWSRDGLTISSENVLIRGGSGRNAIYNANVQLVGVAGFESEDGTKWTREETGTQGDLPWYRTGPIPQPGIPALPRTGDRSSLALWAALLAASACALGLRRRRAA